MILKRLWISKVCLTFRTDLLYVFWKFRVGPFGTSRDLFIYSQCSDSWRGKFAARHLKVNFFFDLSGHLVVRISLYPLLKFGYMKENISAKMFCLKQYYLYFSKRTRLSFGPFSLRIRIRCVWGLLGPDPYGRWKNRLNSKITKIIPVLQKMWFISYEANLFSIEFWL